MNLRLPFISSPLPTGLAWSEDQFHVATLIRDASGVIAGPKTSIPWSRADLAPENPMDLGLRLGEALKAEQISASNSVVALPADWIMSVSVGLPELSSEDFDAFVQLTVERNFPYSPEELQLDTSICTFPAGRQLTVLAVRRELLDRLQGLLNRAGLKPIGFTFGLPAVSEISAPQASPALSFLATPSHSFYLGTADQKVATWRTLDAVDPANSTGLKRALRLSWEQLLPSFRDNLTSIQIIGARLAIDHAQSAIETWAARIEPHINVVRTEIDDLGARSALAVVRAAAAGQPISPQFLPPRPSVIQQWIARYPLRRFGGWGAAAAATATVLLLALGWQAFTLWRLRSDWAEIAPDVSTSEALQANIRQFRSWSDTAPHNLAILRLVSEVFPKNGSVTAKNIEIEDAQTVTITGTTTDNSALLQSLDQLRLKSAVSNLKLDQIRGREPAQFTFKFTWKSIPGA